MALVDPVDLGVARGTTVAQLHAGQANAAPLAVRLAVDAKVLDWKRHVRVCVLRVTAQRVLLRCGAVWWLGTRRERAPACVAEPARTAQEKVSEKSRRAAAKPKPTHRA